MDAAEDAGECVVRGALELARTARCRRMRHSCALRAEAASACAPFQPLEPGLAALTRRVKQQFDPRGLFNPGRMYEGV